MIRYSRNIKVIGEDGQQRLASSSVFIVGCGALGGQLAMLLAAAGVGRIGIADFDTVDISNLQRQLFFDESLVGKSKAEELGRRLRALNSGIEINVFNRMITKSNAAEILGDYDLIADATDNPATKYFIDSTARTLCVPCCLGGVAGWRGQVMLFSNIAGHDGLTYKDIFSVPDQDPSMLPCEIEGVMGPAASTIASLQASEILRFLSRPASSGWTDRMIALDLSLPVMNVVNLA